VEIVVTLLFIVWFFEKGRTFKKNSSWKWIANVRTKRVLVDSERKSHYSRKEILEIYKKYKLSQRECNKFLISKKMDSVTSSAVVSYEELRAALVGKPIPLNLVRLSRERGRENDFVGGGSSFLL
jgi:hypothetical protein